MYNNELYFLELPTLCCLESLNVGYNHLEELPYGLSKLQNMSELKAGGNYIKEFPEEVVCKQNMNILEVLPNPLQSPPLAVCERGFEAMKRHYDSVKKSPSKRKKKKSRSSKKKSFLKLSENEVENITNPPRRVSSLASSIGTIETNSSTVSFDGECAENSKNNTLRVIVVGDPFAGKTSCIHGVSDEDSSCTQFETERTIGVDISQWATSIENGDLKLNFWDFAGQRIYHGTHELFFSQHSLYLLCYDMGVSSNIPTVLVRNDNVESVPASYLNNSQHGNEQQKRVTKALYQDIDEKVQYWIDSVQTSVPGSVIMIVATHDDKFDTAEAEKRCSLVKDRVFYHERNRIKELKDKLLDLTDKHLADSVEADRLRRLILPLKRPKLIFGDSNQIPRVSCSESRGFSKLRHSIIMAASKFFPFHVGTNISSTTSYVEMQVKRLRHLSPYITLMKFIQILNEGDSAFENDKVVDALHFLSNNGELCYFGDLTEVSPFSHHLHLIIFFCLLTIKAFNLCFLTFRLISVLLAKMTKKIFQILRLILSSWIHTGLLMLWQQLLGMILT